MHYLTNQITGFLMTNHSKRRCTIGMVTTHLSKEPLSYCELRNMNNHFPCNIEAPKVPSKVITMPSAFLGGTEVESMQPFFRFDAWVQLFFLYLTDMPC